MSGSSSAVPPPSPPTNRGLHVTRSITERVPGTTSSSSRHLHKHTHSSHHNHITGHISSSLHRARERSRDGRGGGGRASLDVKGTEDAAPANSVREPGRSESVLVPAGGEALGAVASGVPLNLDTEEEMRKQSEKAEARVTGIRKALASLAVFSTTTNRRLDDTYYVVLQKLTTLQNTILALKDLAQASSAASAGFIAESQSVLAEAQSQLDALGSFAEQESRVRALQDRVHGGREKIAALSGRVDVVRTRVERWERADRDWQERTRRRLKIVWGVVMGVALMLLVLYWGARLYAPEIEGVVRELRDEAVEVRVRSGAKVGEVGLGRGDQAGNEEGDNGSSMPALKFGRAGGAEQIDEVLRALDEL